MLAESPGADEARGGWGSLLVRLALAWSAGLIAGGWVGVFWLWFGLGLLLCLCGAVLLLRRETYGRSSARRRLARGVALAALGCVAAAWLIVQRDYTAAHTAARYINDEGAIVRVAGRIASPPRDVVSEQGPFGAFNYRDPGTLFELDLQRIDTGGGWEDCSGTILVRIKQHDHRPMLGQRIEATGWLSTIGPTQNPGEFDYAAYLKSQGVLGRMTLMRRGNWEPLGPPPQYTFTGLRRWLGDEAAISLRRGLPHDPQQTGLLEALLLGRRTGDIDELSDSFRAVGLAHVLSISGAHLGILLLLVWGLGRLLIGRPTVVAWGVMAVLVLFLLVVPWRTPIVRAAIMAGVFCVGYGFGRRLRGVEMLAGAALIVLVWKPGDLFTAGFQLSFGAVGGLLLFARPVSLRLWPEPTVQLFHPTAAQQGWRWFVDFVAVSVVAFLVAVPLVMYHFKLLSPLAALLSMFALPVLTGLLGVGYLKILLGVLLPSASSLLAMPTAWLADSLVALVDQSRRMPAASVPLMNQPTIAWTAAALAVVVAWLAGRFDHRRVAGLLALVLVIGWAVLEQRPHDGQAVTERPPAMEVVMFGVGDGSCYLLRSGGETAMYDCGSQEFLRIGERSIVPALQELGVQRLAFVMLSHPDLDHFAGVLDVVDAMAVDRVIVSAEVLREAESAPRGSAGYLVEQLRSRGIEPEVAGQGWSETLGQARLDILWPAPDFESDHNNNHSLVLRAEAGGQRMLLNGDIQGEAIDALLSAGVDLRAEVTDLAHHGSWVDESPAWFAAVLPRLVLQSSGPRRPERDRWAGYLRERNIPRLATDATGMVRIAFTEEGRLVWETHRGGGGALEAIVTDEPER